MGISRVFGLAELRNIIPAGGPEPPIGVASPVPVAWTATGPLDHRIHTLSDVAFTAARADRSP